MAVSGVPGVGVASSYEVLMRAALTQLDYAQKKLAGGAEKDKAAATLIQANANGTLASLRKQLPEKNYAELLTKVKTELSSANKENTPPLVSCAAESAQAKSPEPKFQLVI